MVQGPLWAAGEGMMFRRKNRSNTHLGSGESIESSASSENLYGSRDRLANTTGQFELYLLGSMTDVNLGGIYTRDPDVQLIDKIEEAQLEGKVSLVAKEENIVSLTISKYGIKVTHRNKKDVLDRHPLYTVAQVIHYVDSFDKNNVAFKIGQVQPGSTVCDCHIFQCQSEDQALNVCAAVKTVYDFTAPQQS